MSRLTSRLRHLLEIVVIVTLLGGGWFAYCAVTFHRPAPIVGVARG